MISIHRYFSIALVLLCSANALAQDKPNILVIWGDDIGVWNISHMNRGMMGYKTPNIDRIAKEGICLHRLLRSAILHGGSRGLPQWQRAGPHRHDQGRPARAPQGWQETDVTFAAVLKGQGYATGQFGKNHQGDRDEHLPTNHGFDEFMGNLYHLNAEEEPEDRDYPADMKLADGSTFREKFGPRGVISRPTARRQESRIPGR